MSEQATSENVKVSQHLAADILPTYTVILVGLDVRKP